MMNDIPWKLLEKHFANSADKELSVEVNSWVDNEPENTMIYTQLLEYYKSEGSLPVNFEPNVTNAKAQVNKALSGNGLIKSRQLYQSSLLWKIAAVFIVGCLCWWMVNYSLNTTKPVFTELFSSDSISTTISLADGSQVWLNAHSTIKYPKKFENNREVYLQGEAYFEIAHDARHPFVVNAGNTRTRVLGTKFNIKAYSADSSVAVTLTEGRVNFGVKSTSDIFLTPGQQGIYDLKNGSLVKKQTNNPNFMAWKTLEFHFDGQPLGIVFQTLAEVYHFNYQFNNPQLTTRLLTASFLHRPLDEILQSISLAADIKISSQQGIYSIQ
jgi:transmembrane sensor